MNSKIEQQLTKAQFKIKYGFGVSTAMLAFGNSAAIFLNIGIVRSICIGLVLVLLTYMIWQFRRYNKPGWSNVHYRGMFIFQIFAGFEWGSADRDSRKPEMKNPFRYTIQFLCGFYSIREDIEKIFDRWINHKAEAVGELMSSWGSTIFPEADMEKLQLVSDKLGSKPPQVQDAIAGIIERLYGPEETLRYYRALIKGQAQ